ncbi:MAG: glycosyltransferase [Cetobacterium sp.]|uniref:glycosyltransferase n=1 Tax=Cetobacterium sp. TaxID=2071632 RepID=UPI003F3D9CDC
MYEVWYVSCHGFGHITRSIAQLEKKLGENSNFKCIIVSGEKQIEFAKLYFKDYSDRVIFRETLTDVGLVNKKNSLGVDKELLEIELKDFISKWDNIVEEEITFLKDYQIGDVFCDISPIGILVSKKLKKKVNLISNFTWYQQYSYLNLDSEITQKYLKLDKIIDNLYLYPLNLDFSHISPEIIKIDFISRKISIKKVEEIKIQYGESIFISCGKSAHLDEITITNFNGTVFTTSGIKVKNIDGKVLELPVDILDTQNYIAASDFIIAKAGWGTVAEAVCAETPMILLEREGVLEDTHIIGLVKEKFGANSVKLDELKKVDYNKLISDLFLRKK